MLYWFQLVFWNLGYVFLINSRLVMQDCVRWLEVDDYEKAQLASRRFLRLETSVMEGGFLVSHICFYETLISIPAEIIYSFTNKLIAS